MADSSGWESGPSRDKRGHPSASNRRPPRGYSSAAWGSDSYSPSGSGSNHPRTPVDSGWSRGDAHKASLPASLPSRPPVTVGGSSDRAGGPSSWKGRDADWERDHEREREFQRGPRSKARDPRTEDMGHDRSREPRSRGGDRYVPTRERSLSPRPSRWGGGRPRDRSPIPGRSRESSYRPPRDVSPHQGYLRSSPPPTTSSSYRPPHREREASSYFSSKSRPADREWDAPRSQRDVSPSYDSDRQPLRRGGLSNRRDSLVESHRERSPPSRDAHSPPPFPSRESTHAEYSYTDAFIGPEAGIPTGPRSGLSSSRGGPSRGGRGGLRGGPVPRGPSHPRGGINATTSWAGRGRGAPPVRGRGRGGMYGGSVYDEPPARSLARKVDAGGNAVTPDLLPAASSADEGIVHHALNADLEDGEREEGEMESGDVMPTRREDTGSNAEGQAAALPSDAVPLQQSRDLHLGTLPHRGSFAQEHAKSGSNTPNTPINAATPSGPNPYSSKSWTGRPPTTAIASSTAVTKPRSSSQAGLAPRTKTIASYTAHDFPRAVQPEWDAELWTLSAHRLASAAQMPLSNNYSIALSAASQPPPSTTTPGVTIPGHVSSVSATAAAASLRAALLELKEANTDMEMSAFRRDECERARAELV